MLRQAFTAVYVFILVVSGQELSAANGETTSLRTTLEVLDGSKVSGSLEISGHCGLEGTLPEFPPFRTPRREGPPLQVLREIFGDDPAMHVTQEPVGTIRMVEIGVPTDFLNIRISHISFDNNGAGPSSAYNPNIALRAIVGTPEVVAFMHTHDIQWPFSGSGIGASSESSSDLPHVSGSLENVTLSQALDHVLKTFPGIWVYENCPKTANRSRLVYLRFYHLRRVGSAVLVVE